MLSASPLTKPSEPRTRCGAHANKALLPVASLLIVTFFAAVSRPVLAQETSQTAQAAAPQLAMTDALNTLQPLLAEVNSALSSVDARRWKAPGDVRDQTASDIQSIQRDLNGTLPGLLSTAQSAPGSIAPAFAVFRNIDALYDVLLRITETATLAGSQQEATKLEQVRSDLQSRRSQLGTAILSSATAQDANVTNLQTSLRAANNASAAAAPKKIVVNDGPDSAAKPVKKRKPAAATKPAAPAPPTTPQ